MRGVADKAYAYAADHRLLSAGDTSYVYDADGFLLRRTRGAEVTQYAYASTGEPRSVLLPDGRLVEYDNDALGRRVAKRIDGAIVEKYLWLGRTRLLAVFHADGSLKYRFEYADDRTPVAMTAGGQTYYLMYDQVGSLRAVTDATGAIVKTVTYDSFGTVLEDSNPALDLPFGFAGGLHDADTGLVRFGFRDYAPEVGRWTAKDPIGFAGGDSDLYGYCGGDPVNFYDLDGTRPVKAGRIVSFLMKLLEEALFSKLQDDMMKDLAQQYDETQRIADELSEANNVFRDQCYDSCEHKFDSDSTTNQCNDERQDCMDNCLKETFKLGSVPFSC